ncbi:MAG: copper resistance protein CopC [Methylococcales bacterium]|nr:copper resistance protein CopC [Methylococcales bacterium]
MSNLARLSWLLLLLNVIPGAIWAHAVVTDNTLKIDPVQAGQAKKITLTFNSQVELALSHFDLVKKGDLRERLDIAPGPKQGQVIVNLPPLLTGEHAIQLKVFAADGHLTEDLIRFFVVD